MPTIQTAPVELAPQVPSPSHQTSVQSCRFGAAEIAYPSYRGCLDHLEGTRAQRGRSSKSRCYIFTHGDPQRCRVRPHRPRRALRRGPAGRSTDAGRGRALSSTGCGAASWRNGGYPTAATARVDAFLGREIQERRVDGRAPGAARGMAEPSRRT